MLESEEIDEDYFTPVASATLASIFGNKSENDSNIENETLKYTPTKHNANSKKAEESKASQCIFACALLVYEWFHNTYTSKGKMGFAIMNILKNDSQTIVLYDSSKVTISSTVITPKLDITLNEQNYLSYYDSNQKYWSIYATEDETKKIIDILKSFGVTIQYSSHKDKEAPEPVRTVEITKIFNLEAKSKNAGSDTDSSLNKKTKASLLNRMANMGHSVLPPRTNITTKTSDSSDTNDTYEHQKIRHKSVKGVVKKSSEKITLHEHHVPDNQRIALLHQGEQTSENSPLLYTFINSQLVPLTNTNIIKNASSRVGNELDFFITEQRVSSSELRINMNRITDKVDHILNKVNSLDISDKNSVASDFQNKILVKLLKEYEDKIKRYEQLLSSKCTSLNITNKDSSAENEIGALERKIDELEAINLSTNNEIAQLKKEIASLKHVYSEEVQRKHNQENIMHRQIKHLEETIVSKDEEIALLKQTHKNLPGHSNDQTDKIKQIMNETYRAISVKFENEETYTGENVKNLIGMLIKKITMDSLNEV